VKLSVLEARGVQDPEIFIFSVRSVFSVVNARLHPLYSQKKARG
jgi:hypothetical protein